MRVLFVFTAILAHSSAELAGFRPEGEANCTLQSTRGILFSCDVHPLVQASDTPQLQLLSTARKMLRRAGRSAAAFGMSHYVVDINKMTDGSSVYVVTQALKAFVDEVLPEVNKRFVLVTGDAVCSPKQVLDDEGFARLADSPKVMRWFVQNAASGEADHPKVTPMPLGLDYHTLAQGPRLRWGPQASAKSQEREFLHARDHALPFRNRSGKVFVAIGANSPERRRMIKTLRPQTIVEYVPFTNSRREYYQELGGHQFAASPRGHGVDCHRTWEILSMGAIPVVDPLLHRLFDDNNLTVVSVSPEEWQRLGSDSVREKMAKAVAKKEQAGDALAPALTLEYWVSKIRAAGRQS